MPFGQSAKKQFSKENIDENTIFNIHTTIV